MRQFHKQVQQTVKEVVAYYRNLPAQDFKGNLSVFACPMQSGKTELIEHAFLELRKIYPKIIGFYICGFTHTEFNSQNSQRLEHLKPKGLHFLKLKDRNDILKDKTIVDYAGKQMVLFFDENHFADGTEQSIDRFLMKQDAFEKALLIGVSATPFSSIEKAKEIFTFKKENMPSYKGISDMFDEGDIVEADQLIDKSTLEVDVTSNAYSYLRELIDTSVDGYALIRCNRTELANALRSQLENDFGDNVYVRDWNQKHQLSPDFFKEPRGQFTVVLVQQKARMGNTIPTERIKMVYEYSPNATVATIAQGLPGRCCGHGKRNHRVRVYTNMLQITAYMIFERNPRKTENFARYCEENNLIPSSRSQIDSDDSGLIGGFITVDEFEGPKAEYLKKYFPKIKRALDNEGFKRIVNRPHCHYMSTSKTYRDHWITGVKTKNNPLFTKGLRAIPGSLSLLFVDDPKLKLKPQICWAYRVPEKRQLKITPKKKSIYRDRY